jgi:acetyl esterase
MTTSRSLLHLLRRKTGAAVVDGLFRGLSWAGGLHPASRAERYGIRVTRDVAYRPGGRTEHLLDAYVPPGDGPHPIVMYIHGGGFRILSKEALHLVALAYARRGYLVFNINYRLAPRHPFPAAHEDAAAAYAWMIDHASEYRGDLDRLVLAGESAGANLVTSLAVFSCYRRPEPYALEVYRRNVVPKVVVAACGYLQVSDPERFSRRRKLPTFIKDRLAEVHDAYLESSTATDRALADPLLIFESDVRPDRPLPEFYAPVGTKDPVLDDTRRLKAALDRLGTPCSASYFKGEPHAFHALLVHPNARRCWKETFEILDRVIGGETVSGKARTSASSHG